MTPAELKLHLLIEGVSYDPANLRGLSFKSDKYLHNDRHFVDREMRHSVPQELLLSSYDVELCVGLLARPRSRFHLACIDGELVISVDDRQIDVDVKFLEEPSVWRMKTSDGVPAYKVLSIPGTNELNLWTWHDCAYHYMKVGCQFCNTTSTSVKAGTGRLSGLATAHAFLQDSDKIENSLVVKKLAQQSVEVLSHALSNDFVSEDYWFTIIGGNVPNDKLDHQYEFCCRLMTELDRRIPHLRPDRRVVNIMPPSHPQSLVKLKNAGASVFMGNMEIWGAEDFARICPGKAAYGRERFMEMLAHAVRVFGRGNVWSSFVCGLEPMSQQLQAYEILAELGVVAGANVFHKDPFIKVDAVDSFTADEVRKYYIRAAEILKEHDLVPFYSIKSRRSSLLWEAFEGLLV